jgi:hypothetical protein
LNDSKEHDEEGTTLLAEMTVTSIGSFDELRMSFKVNITDLYEANMMRP